jgi:hypothetical protein
MAIVQGIKEKCHLPIYDSLSVDGAQQLGDVESTSTLKFFVNVQGKTKLETNLQSASLLPHYNTFEARAMRVVISDLPPEFPADPTVEDSDYPVTDEDGFQILVGEDGSVLDVDENGDPVPVDADDNASTADTIPDSWAVFADFELGLDRVMELLAEARENADQIATIDVDEAGVTIGAFDADDNELDVDNDTLVKNVLDAGGRIDISVGDLEHLIDTLDERDQPPKEQLKPNNGSGTIIGKLIYNTVTTLYVGEKIMIQMPTWFFPAGAGPYSETGHFTTHGEPSPTATFRFAEPIHVDKGQNFRVEMEVPDTDVLKEIQRIYGPLNIWVVLDGYMTRDVQ